MSENAWDSSLVSASKSGLGKEVVSVTVRSKLTFLINLNDLAVQAIHISDVLALALVGALLAWVCKLAMACKLQGNLLATPLL